MLVGLCGKKESGKSAVSDYLLQFGFGFECRSLATPLKAVAEIIFGFDEAQLYGDQKETVDPRYGFSARYALQHLGTEVVRGIHPDAWVYAWARTLTTVHEKSSVVVDDVRFPNEIRAIKDRGGIILKLHKVGESVEFDGHASEDTDVLEADIDIYAEAGDLAGLYDKVVAALSLIKPVNPVDEHTRKFGVSLDEAFDIPHNNAPVCVDCSHPWEDHFGSKCPKE